MLHVTSHFRVLTYIFMVDTLHEHQLSKCAFGMSLILKRPTEFLYSHVLLKVVVIRWAKREKDAWSRWKDAATDCITSLIWGEIRALEHTRLFPEHPSQWVLDSDTASTLWMLYHPHQRCRILFLAYFCSWWSRSVGIRMRQTSINLDHKNKTKSTKILQLLWYLHHCSMIFLQSLSFLAQQNKLEGHPNLFLALGFISVPSKRK